MSSYELSELSRRLTDLDDAASVEERKEQAARQTLLALSSEIADSVQSREELRLEVYALRRKVALATAQRDALLEIRSQHMDKQKQADQERWQDVRKLREGLIAAAQRWDALDISKAAADLKTSLHNCKVAEQDFLNLQSKGRRLKGRLHVASARATKCKRRARAAVALHTGKRDLYSAFWVNVLKREQPLYE